MTIIEKYKEKIIGELSCYDRIVLRGTIPGMCYAQGMSNYLYSKGIRIFDYARHVEGYTATIRKNAEEIAKNEGIEIEFVRKKNIRKEDIIAKKIKEREIKEGLVHILSAMESCPTYKPWHDKKTGKTYLKGSMSKCLHYYFYIIDEELGLCYVRVPTWCPFSLQVYFNGHGWLSNRLKKKGIKYNLVDNAFDYIEDFAQAQQISNGFDVSELHKRLDKFVKKYCPVIKEFNQAYHWSIMQAEYSTDIVFKEQEELRSIYGDLVKTAIHTVTPDNIATFLGKKPHGNFKGESGNNYNVRIEGSRIKHTMESASIKMYDKFSKILRIETTTNKVSFFKHYREVEQRNKIKVKQMANFKKNIYSFPPLTEILRAANSRYLDFISQIETKEIGRSKINHISKSVEYENRNYKGFNFFDDKDIEIFRFLVRGENCISGFMNKTMRHFFHDKNSAQISRLIKRLRVHGLIKKINNCYKYYLTSFGRQSIITALKLKEMFIIPELNLCC